MLMMAMIMMSRTSINVIDTTPEGFRWKSSGNRPQHFWQYCTHTWNLTLWSNTPHSSTFANAVNLKIQHILQTVHCQKPYYTWTADTANTKYYTLHTKWCLAETTLAEFDIWCEGGHKYYTQIHKQILLTGVPIGISTKTTHKYIHKYTHKYDKQIHK